MTETQRAAMRLALEALEIGEGAAEECATRYHEAMRGYRQAQHDALDADVAKIRAAITALRAALAEPEPEPVANGVKEQALDALNRMQSILMMSDGRHPRDVLRAFIQLASKPARPLTHPQIHELDWPDDVAFEDILEFARAIERAHGITGGNDE